MTIKDKYHLTFQKEDKKDSTYFFATSNFQESNDIAYHLTCSRKIETTAQIEELQYALENPLSEGFYGDFLGSWLEIHPSSDLAEVGDGDTMLPIQDLKGLLEEWLNFIS
jgi:hypothetical protein